VGTTVMFLVKKEVCNATASFFVTKVWGEVFSHFYTVSVKRHSSMQNLQFDVPGWILCEGSRWCQGKWWARSRLCSPPVSPFLFSVSSDSPCTGHTCFPEQTSYLCQGLCCTFSEICTKFDACLQLDPLQNHIRPDAWLQINGLRCMKFCTLTSKIC
jgi:hypothetical protein